MKDDALAALAAKVDKLEAADLTLMGRIDVAEQKIHTLERPELPPYAVARLKVAVDTLGGAFAVSQSYAIAYNTIRGWLSGRKPTGAYDQTARQIIHDGQEAVRTQQKQEQTNE